MRYIYFVDIRVRDLILLFNFYGMVCEWSESWQEMINFQELLGKLGVNNCNIIWC